MRPNNGQQTEQFVVFRGGACEIWLICSFGFLAGVWPAANKAADALLANDQANDETKALGGSFDA